MGYDDDWGLDNIREPSEAQLEEWEREATERDRNEQSQADNSNSTWTPMWQVPEAVQVDPALPHIQLPPQMLPGLFRGDYGVLTAAGGTGKSFFALEWAVFRLLGLAFYGDFPESGSDNKSTLGPIVRATVLCLEDQVDILRDRLTRILRFFSQDIPNLNYDPHDHDSKKEKPGLLNQAQVADVLNRLTVRSLKGGDAVQIVRHVQGTATIGHEDIDYLAKCALNAQEQTPDLLVIDPLIKVGGYSENSNEEAALFAAAMEGLARRLTCTILLTHHVSKFAITNGSDNQSAARGASAIVDESRATYPMSRVDHKQGLRTKCVVGMSINSPKLNYCRPIAETQYFRAKSGVIVPDRYVDYHFLAMDSDKPVNTTAEAKREGVKKKRSNMEVGADES